MKVPKMLFVVSSQNKPQMVVLIRTEILLLLPRVCVTSIGNIKGPVLSKYLQTPVSVE